MIGQIHLDAVDVTDVITRFNVCVHKQSAVWVTGYNTVMLDKI